MTLHTKIQALYFNGSKSFLILKSWRTCVYILLTKIKQSEMTASTDTMFAQFPKLSSVNIMSLSPPCK